MIEQLPSKQTSPLLSHPMSELTFREWEVLLLISEDRENVEIASITNSKIQTISNMRYRIGDKLMLKGRNKLGQFARQHRDALRDLFPILYPPRRRS
ncbi:LuxR C-terminal-related transcriptional regulator [Dyadobacter sp. CY323]|uniref:LuxR C-terminal-related transcriptional regulator n=1 Tax=Dyadobacter sp. CY323 TaxID=2907302 RepID=UPI001F3D66DD|nr:LuxR C-terminal-related transcriptional regulator [Dyadobacter sp. CY323]MCE6990830.1 LuxR C-terminal-related transcriptional regulator [Dyadobacter sp. CY323]